MLSQWRFREYIAPSGMRVIENWYAEQADDVQAAFDAVLEYLAQRSRNEWRRPEFDKLSGKYAKLGELRFEVRNVQYRPFGFFGPGRAEFTLLIGAIKKGKKYDPLSACETALKRMRQVLADQGRSHVYEI